MDSSGSFLNEVIFFFILFFSISAFAFLMNLRYTYSYSYLQTASILEILGATLVLSSFGF